MQMDKLFSEYHVPGGRARLRMEEPGVGRFSPTGKRHRVFPEPCNVVMHYHSSLEVNSIHAAAGNLLLNGNCYPLEKLRLIILPPWCLHGYQIDQSAGWIDVYHLWPKGFEDYLQGTFADKLQRFAPMLIEASAGEDALYPQDELIRDLERLCRQHSSVGAAEAAVLLRLAGMLERHSESEGAGRVHASEKETNQFLRKVIDYTEKNYSRKILLSELGELTGYSRLHVSRLFHRLSGSRYSDYLREVRLSSSLECLRAGLTVTETALSCGFEDTSYFVQCFRQRFGVTPGRMQDPGRV